MLGAIIGDIIGIRPHYYHIETCQQSVPEAITAFLESTSYEDAVRKAVSLGGDADTQAAIAGSIAEAFYERIPEAMIQKAFTRLPPSLFSVIRAWYESGFGPGQQKAIVVNHACKTA